MTKDFKKQAEELYTILMLKIAEINPEFSSFVGDLKHEKTIEKALKQAYEKGKLFQTSSYAQGYEQGKNTDYYRPLAKQIRIDEQKRILKISKRWCFADCINESCQRAIIKKIKGGKK